MSNRLCLGVRAPAQINFFFRPHLQRLRSTIFRSVDSIRLRSTSGIDLEKIDFWMGAVTSSITKKKKMFATKFSWTGKYGKYHIYTDSDESLATLLIKDYLRRSLGKNIDEVDDPRIFKVKISEKMYQKKNISVIYIMKEILESHPVKNLKAIIRTLKVEVTGFSTMKKSALVNKILELKKKGFPVPNVKMYQKPGRKAPAPKAKPPPAPAPAPAKKAKFKVVKQAKKPANLPSWTEKIPDKVFALRDTKVKDSISPGYIDFDNLLGKRIGSGFGELVFGTIPQMEKAIKENKENKMINYDQQAKDTVKERTRAMEKLIKDMRAGRFKFVEQDVTKTPKGIKIDGKLYGKSAWENISTPRGAKPLLSRFFTKKFNLKAGASEKASSFLADIEQKGKSVSEKVKKTQDVKPEMQKEKPKKGGLRNESKLVGKILGIHDQKVRGRYYSATFRKIVAIKNNKLQLVKSDATGKPILGRTGKETKTQMTLEKLESYLQHKEKRHAHIYEPTPESLKDDSRAMLLGGKDGEGKAITDMFLK